MLIERETVQNMKMKFQQGAFLKYGKTEADPHQFSRRQFKFVPRRLHCCSFAHQDNWAIFILTQY